MKFDGKEYPVEGPNVSPGAVCSGRRANEHAVEFTYKRDGKMRETRQVELSADGKILTMTVRRSGQEKANVFVFDRE